MQSLNWILSALFMNKIVNVMTAAVQSQHFITDSRFDGIIPTINKQWSCTSLINCALICMQDEDCDSYAFDSSKCYGFTNRIITTTPTTVNLKALYYENKGALGRNLAAGKPSSQNGLYDGHGSQGNYTAKMANDDSRVPEPNGLLGSCSHLGYSSYANTIWWKVDLEDVYRITNVALLARKDPFPSELEHLKIAVGRTSTGNFIDCVVDTGPGFYGEMRSFACTVPITGQYVQVSKYTSGWTFTLCELEVFGEPKP